MEDSVSAVDAEDKARVYANISGALKGTLEAPYVKDGRPWCGVLRQMFGFEVRKVMLAASLGVPCASSAMSAITVSLIWPSLQTASQLPKTSLIAL